jgi:hypothetical protein
MINMKRFALICLFASMAFGMANAQNTKAETKEVPENGAKIRFTELEHNYGTIQKGGNGECEFTFVNEGNEPLILSNVKASCGCTTPSYTQKPVMPGQQGTIHVKYNTNNVGAFSKTVTVTSNAVNDGGRVVLRIKGNVKQEGAAAQPAVQPKAQPAKRADQAPVQPKMKIAGENVKAQAANVEEKAKK